MNEKPSETPRPWLTQSPWSISPFLFLLELFGFTGAFWLLAGLGILGDPFWVIPAVISFCAYQTGRRCAIDEGGRVPRPRLWGTAVLIGLIYSGFLFLIFRAALPYALETFQKDPKLREEFYRANPEYASFTLEDLAAAGDLPILITALFIGALLFLLHVVFLLLGARRAEHHLLEGKKP